MRVVSSLRARLMGMTLAILSGLGPYTNSGQVDPGLGIELVALRGERLKGAAQPGVLQELRALGDARPPLIALHRPPQLSLHFLDQLRALAHRGADLEPVEAVDGSVDA